MRKLARELCSIDPRTLAFTRIFIGCVLLTDLLKRAVGIPHWYTNDSLTPNHRVLWHPPNAWPPSVVFGMTNKAQLTVGFVLIGLVYCAFLVGYRTRLMQVLSWLGVASLQVRVPMVGNGGDFVICELLLWTVFLPMGARCSVDALRSSLRSHRELDVQDLRAYAAQRAPVQPVRSLAVLAAMLQLAVIYLFNAVHKSGSTWHDGSAVHYMLHQTRIVTPLGVWVRTQAPTALLASLTYATVVIEYAAPILILSPWGRPWTTRLAMFTLVGLHTNIALLTNLGIFSPTMVAFISLLISARDWELLAGWLRRRKATVRLVLREGERLGLHFTRVLLRLDALHRIEVALPESEEESTLAQRTGFAVVTADQRVCSGRHGLSAVLRALPLGAALDVSLRPLRPWLAAFWRERDAWTSALGYDRDPGPAYVVPPARRKLARFGYVLGELLVPPLVFIATWQLLLENAAARSVISVRQPRWLDDTVNYLRLNQGWSMFAPEAPLQDMTMVVDAVTVSGRHVDPYNEIASDFADPSTRKVPARTGQNVYFCGYTLRLPYTGEYQDLFAEWIMSYHQRTGRREDQIRSFKAYVVEHDSPRPGETEPRNTRTRVILSR